MSVPPVPESPLQEVENDLGQVGPPVQTILGMSVRLAVAVIGVLIVVLLALGGLVLSHLPQPEPVIQNQAPAINSN